MTKAYIVGSYTTKFGELWERDFRDIGIEAAMGAIKDSKLGLKDIDAVYVGNMAASRFTGQDHLGALFASGLGLDCPAFHIEAACASGGLAVRAAWMDILSGQSKNVLVLGVEKMNDVDASMVTSGLAGASDEEWEGFYGVTFPSLYAMIAREHMNIYGTSREQLALCAVKNHKNALNNEKAQFRKEITVQQVINSTEVADPFGLFDCSPISDGASAIILSSEKKSGVSILSSGHGQDSIALHDRDDITTLSATVKAADRAFEQAKIKRENIDLMEVHDCFTIAEIVAYEDLGFAKKGEGGKFIEEGHSSREGKLPTNSTGGLKACGHPVGATGVKQIATLYDQMLGRAGKLQLDKDIKYALAHNVGGSGGTAVVTILEKQSK